MLLVVEGDEGGGVGGEGWSLVRGVDGKWRGRGGEWLDEGIGLVGWEVGAEGFVVWVVGEEDVEGVGERVGLDGEEVGGIVDKGLVGGGECEMEWMGEDVWVGEEEVWVGMCEVVVSEE